MTSNSDPVDVVQDFLAHLRTVNAARLAAWEGDDAKTDGIFHATELGGEVGEVLNVVKKLHREAMGWRGSRATLADLADELGDVLICADKLAAHYGIDLAEATARKFNATSEKVGLPHRLAHAAPPSPPASEDRLREAERTIETLRRALAWHGDPQRMATTREEWQQDIDAAIAWVKANPEPGRPSFPTLAAAPPQAQDGREDTPDAI
jgi:NTP pyrophosphatase (non-canonical NTP hydrolase)